MAYRIVNGVIETDTASEIIELHKLMNGRLALVSPDPTASVVPTADGAVVAPKKERKPQSRRPKLAIEYGVHVGQVWESYGKEKRVIQIQSLQQNHIIPSVLKSKTDKFYLKKISYSSLAAAYKLVKNVGKMSKAESETEITPRVGQTWKSDAKEVKDRTIKIISVSDTHIIPKIISSISNKPLAKVISINMLHKRYKLVKDV